MEPIHTLKGSRAALNKRRAQAVELLLCKVITLQVLHVEGALSDLQAKLVGLHWHISLMQQGLRDKASGDPQQLEEALARLETRLLDKLGDHAAQINTRGNSQEQVEVGKEARAKPERIEIDLLT